jgi:hypothetical protein
MSTSTVTIFGARSPLRDGEILRAEIYAREEHWYVGGQSALSYQRAWQLLESLLDDPRGWRVAEFFGTPHRCASARFGNCLALRLAAPA